MMSTPDAPVPYRTLPAAELADPTAPLRWLLTDLFLVGAAGILGGAPKTGKSFFALELAVAVASGQAALGRFAVAAPGPVLLLAAEDPPAVVVQRLAALATARDAALATLPLAVIVEPGLRLPESLDRLAATVAQQQARLLILDPLIRVHRADENSAGEMAAVLDGLRALARATDCAVLLVHHTRKAAAAGGVAGHALRGSSDLHAFGDTNLYLRRLASDGPLELRIEHRAAPCPPPLRLHLRTDDLAGQPRARFVSDDIGPADPLGARVLALVRAAPAPVPSAALRTALGVRKQTLLALLHQLADERLLRRVGREGWTLGARPVPGPDPTGRANGNRSAP